MGSVGSKSISNSGVDRFNTTFDISNLSETDFKDIAQYIIDNNILDDYEFIGIRTVEPEFAEDLRPSTIWIDGEKTEEDLNGVSALNTKVNYWDDADTIAQKLKNTANDASFYIFGDRKPFIIMSDNAEGGEDINEIIMSDAKLFDVSKYIKRHKK